MSLEKYTKKRDFTKTSEPKSGKTEKGKLKFVVQRHHASRLHYDFRLEMDGVLKSWAVPKGPSLNPKDKRLAMMVEDHPFDYRTFEGTIPKGNYGAGLVTIFDEGTYESLEKKDHEKFLKKGLNNGNLKFKLQGKKLKGEFALVKLKDAEQNAWLLIKHNDDFAVNSTYNSEDLVPEKIKKAGIQEKKTKAEPAPKSNSTSSIPEKKVSSISYKPMLAKLANHVFDDDEWVYEKKLDGYRCLAYTGNTVRLISRNDIDFGEKYKPVQDALEKLTKEAVIDGELVIEDNQGKSIFQELQNYDPSNKKIILKFYVFDLLYLEGHDLRGLHLVQRKELLKALIKNLRSDIIVYSEHIIGQGVQLLKKAEKEGWEGIIGKNGNSSYEGNRRSDQWLKFKLQNTQEAIICGYTKPAGSRKYFGALVLGMHDGKQIKYIGNCGTGFNDTSLKELFDKMTPLHTDEKPFDEEVNQGKKPQWIKPELVCEVTFAEWTNDGHLRHPVFKGLRIDKGADEVKQESDYNVSKKQPIEDKPNNNPKMPDELEETFGRKKVKLTNLNKLYWKNEGITKGQLINYYREIADYLLPCLKDRPLSLNRHPNGIDGPNFFQKDLDTDQIPAWIKSTPIHSESNNKNIDYLICNDLPTLLWMANLGCIEINPWLSTYKKPENPDFAVMDLDPNDVDDFTEVVKVALTTKSSLDEMGVKAFIKTSGSRGLHIYVHIGGKYDYDISKNFIQYLGHIVNREHPDTTSLERSPSKRKNKIYLDFLQNRKGQTIAAPYSARPKPGATVSTPLEWDEVNEHLDIKQFTIFNTLERINKKGDLWRNITDGKADLKKALEIMKGK